MGASREAQQESEMGEQQEDNTADISAQEMLRLLNGVGEEEERRQGMEANSSLHGDHGPDQVSLSIASTGRPLGPDNEYLTSQCPPSQAAEEPVQPQSQTGTLGEASRPQSPNWNQNPHLDTEISSDSSSFNFSTLIRTSRTASKSSFHLTQDPFSIISQIQKRPPVTFVRRIIMPSQNETTSSGAQGTNNAPPQAPTEAPTSRRAVMKRKSSAAASQPKRHKPSDTIETNEKAPDGSWKTEPMRNMVDRFGTLSRAQYNMAIIDAAKAVLKDHPDLLEAVGSAAAAKYKKAMVHHIKSDKSSAEMMVFFHQTQEPDFDFHSPDDPHQSEGHDGAGEADTDAEDGGEGEGEGTAGAQDIENSSDN